MANKRKLMMVKATEFTKKRELSDSEIKAMLTTFGNEVSKQIKNAFSPLSKPMTALDKLIDSWKKFNSSLENANTIMKGGK